MTRRQGGGVEDAFLDQCARLGDGVSKANLPRIARLTADASDPDRKTFSLSRDGPQLTFRRQGGVDGKGRAGVVYPVRWRTGDGRWQRARGDGSEVVVKQVRRKGRGIDEEIAFETSVQLVARCALDRHRASAVAAAASIPSVLFLASDERALYIGMQRMDRSLKQLLVGGKLTMRPFCRILAGVALSLGVLQSSRLRLMHGDLHAENVMVAGRPPRAYIIDFGWATVDEAPSASSSGGASPRRVPERVDLLPSRDLLTLIWSCAEWARDDAVRGWCADLVRPVRERMRKAIFPPAVLDSLGYPFHASYRLKPVDETKHADVLAAFHPAAVLRRLMRDKWLPADVRLAVTAAAAPRRGA
jgi:serine/threonine protein kinase